MSKASTEVIQLCGHACFYCSLVLVVDVFKIKTVFYGIFEENGKKVGLFEENGKKVGLYEENGKKVGRISSRLRISALAFLQRCLTLQ